MPNKTSHFNKDVSAGAKNNKQRNTSLVCAYMDGSVTLKLLVITKLQQMDQGIIQNRKINYFFRSPEFIHAIFMVMHGCVC